MSEEHPGSNGLETNTTPPASAATQPDWSGFLSSLDQLNDKLADKLGSKLDTLKTTVENVTPKPPPPAAPDYDTMTNAELAAYIHGSIGNVIAERIAAALNPLTEHLNSLQRTVVTTNATSEVEKLRGQHKDFTEWKNEMVELAKAHPTLGFQDVYRLARANNPQKAGEMDLKYNPPPPKPKPFGGFAPSSAGKAGEPVLKGEEAARAAYREVSERHPGVLAALTEL